MRPIMMEMKDITNSTEVFESRPHPFFKIFIYLVLFIVLILGIWAYFSKIDIVVTAQGLIKTSDSIITLTNESAGKVNVVNYKDGDYIKKGDVIYEIENENIEQELNNTDNQIGELNSRIQILEAYQNALNGNCDEFNTMEDNPFYDEYKIRLDLVKLQNDSTVLESENMKAQYNTSISSIDNSINYNNNKIDKLTTMLNCILNRDNTFGTDEIYYFSTVKSYIDQYSAIEAEYETKISATNDLELINQYIIEKDERLRNHENEKVITIENELETANSNSVTLNNSKNEAVSQLESVGDDTINQSIEMDKLKEINTAYSEIETYYSQLDELKANRDILAGNLERTLIKAEKSGILNFLSDIVVGNYIESGKEMVTIIPEDDSEYIVETYINNSDIGKVKTDMEANCEVTSYSSKEYGFISGNLKSISEDVKISDESSGSTYYTAIIILDDVCLRNTDGKEANLKVGMNCEISIITGEKSVFRFLLEKIDLLD